SAGRVQSNDAISDSSWHADAGNPTTRPSRVAGERTVGNSHHTCRVENTATGPVRRVSTQCTVADLERTGTVVNTATAIRRSTTTSRVTTECAVGNNDRAVTVDNA